jgi:hypothetical protein
LKAAGHVDEKGTPNPGPVGKLLRSTRAPVTAKAGFWIAIALALIGLLYLLGPLIHAVRARF